MERALTVRTSRRPLPALVVGIAAVGLAITAQGLVAGRTFVVDGIFLYGVALVLALRSLDLTRSPDSTAAQDGKTENANGTRLLASNQMALALAAVAVILNLAALRLFGTRVSPNLAWGLYVASVVTAPLAVWLLAGRPRLGPLADRLRIDLLALGSILLVGLFFRLYRIDSLPLGLWWDEAFSGLEVLRIMRDPSYRPVYVAGMAQEPSLIWYTMIPFVWLFGPTSLGVRATALVGGTLGIVATYLLGRELSGRRTGIVAATLIAVMTWHVNFSRIGFNAIWSVTLDAFATYFLVRALRTRSLIAYALAGTMLGLGLNMYYTSRLLPLIFAALLLHRLISQRLAFARQHGTGLLVFAAVTAITVSPLAQFAILYPNEFNARIEQATIIKEIREKQSYDPIVENLRSHLLMFHFRGDHNGRHNLPGAPMLDQVTGALFVLGLAMAIRRIRRPESFLPVIWVPAMLIGGVFSLSFEAPQSLRTIDEVTAVALLAALPVVALWKRLEALGHRPGLGDVHQPQWLIGQQGIRLPVAALFVVALLAWIGTLNYQRYFVQQAGDFAVWNAFSTAETEIARQLNELEGEYQVFLDETLLDRPTIRFLSTQHWTFGKFDPAANLPLRARTHVAIFLEPEQVRAVALLERLYPEARVVAYQPPFGDHRPVLYSVIVPHEQIVALQGLEVRYYDNPTWSGTPTRRERVATLDLGAILRRPGSEMLAAVELRSTLIAPEYGRYVLKLEATRNSELLLDETPLLRGGEEKQVVLAKGNHALRLRIAASEGGPLRLLWQPPGAVEPGPVPSDVLFAPPVSNNGLHGKYFRNPEWSGAPALERIDPTMDVRIHILPLPRPYTVEWSGKIDVPREGIYRFAVHSADSSWLYVDGQLVVTNEGAPRQLREGAIRLAEGFHDIRIRFVDATDHTFIRVFWTPPGIGNRQIIPSERLFPPQGAYLERANDLAPLPGVHAITPDPRDTLAAPRPGAPAPASPAGAAGVLPTARYVEVARIGQRGGGHGQFREPRGVAVDADGNVYVVDTGNHRVQKFNRDGVFVLSWGKKGEGEGEFVEPVAVAIDPNGNVVVLDAATAWIRRFTPDGQLVDRLGGPKAQFYNPRGIAIDPRGNIYVADTGMSSVVAFDPSGRRIGRHGVKGRGPGQLLEPTDVLVNPDGTFLVADSANSKVVWFDADWQPLAEWPLPKSGSVFGPHFSRAPTGDILVTDPEGKRIIRYNSSGQPKDQIGGGERFDRPIQMAVDDAGNIFVADPGAHQIVKLRPAQ